MPLDDLAKAVLGRQEIDRLVEILMGREMEATADRLSSLHRFKNAITALLPDIGERVGDEILATRPFKAAEELTKLALRAATVPKKSIDVNHPLPVMAARKWTHQKGILKRKGTGAPKVKRFRPDGTKQGRLSEFAGARLYPVPGAKPAIPGTRAALSLKIVAENPGISYRDFKAKGGDGFHLPREVKNNRIRAEQPEKDY